MLSLTPDNLRLLSTIAVLFATINGGWFFAIRWTLSRTMKHFDSQIEALVGDARQVAERVTKLEINIANMRAAFAEKYVDKKDWIRLIGSMHSRMDDIADALNRLREEMGNARSEHRHDSA